jgi:tetratricopeptide (TPR) repeat protein
MPIVTAPDPRLVGALVSLVHQGHLQEAEQRVSALLRTQPGEGVLWKVLSVALMRQGKDALPALRRAAGLLPQDAEAHANLGSALHARGQWDAALASLRHSLTLQPRNPEALVEAGDAQRALGAPREALILYQEALRLDARRAEAHNNLGNAFLDLNQPGEAALCYRATLALKPDDAQVLCNLGNALRQTGQIEEAMTCTQRAIALAPALSMAHNNLGLLLATRAQRAAVASYREALRLNPGYVEALNNLGNVLRELGERREALSLYQRAVQLDPSRTDSHCNLGYALLDARRVTEAVASFRGALALQANSVPVHLGLAAALRVQGLPAEAEASCQSALAAEPRSPGALSLLGELRADRGQFAEAQELFERAIAVDPDFAPAYGGIAAHRRMTRSDSAWHEGARRLLARPLPLSEEIHLRYALGKYFDDVGEYDEAFSSYQAANELTKRYGTSYDRARLTQLVDRIISVCNAAFVQEAHPASSASELPVFIIGMPRSGTSLTEQILASHPTVYGAGEVRFWDQAFATLAKPGPQSDHTPQTVAGMARAYLDRVGAKAGAALRITDKMPANFLYAGLMHAAFPRARIIHMQRHPLDTCLSVYFQNFFNVSPYANDLGSLAHYYGEYLRISAHWRRVLPAGTLLEVPYEELVADAEGWTRRMLDFIALPWDPKCLDFHRTDRVVITASKWQVRQPISAASVGRWRNYQKYLTPLLELCTASPPS